MNPSPSEEELKKLDENLTDHNYDGIHELDNPLPNWWVSLFYGTIGFSVIYMILFTFFIPSAGARADKKVDELLGRNEAKAEAAAPAEASADAAPGQFPSGPEALKKGGAVFAGKCAVCHGPQGQGMIGPNLTDAYWIHGKGTEADMYKVVIEGVPEKGMISWKTMLSDEEIRAVVVYMKTLQGTSPANPKAPQGEKVG